jgi:hypothetical protein
MSPLPRNDEDLARLVPPALALPDAPRAWIDRAACMFRGEASFEAADLVRRAVRRLQATLTFDSWAASPLALGMRAAMSDSRHLLLSAEGRDIDVRIVPAGSRYTVAGQILGSDESGVVELAPADVASARETALDAMGEFRIDDVERGRYVLTLRVEGGRARGVAARRGASRRMRVCRT